MVELFYCSRCSHKKPVDAFIRARKGGNGLVKKKFSTCNDCYRRFERYEGKKGAQDEDDDNTEMDSEVTGCASFKCKHSELVDEIRDVFETEGLEKNVCARIFVDIEEDSEASHIPSELHLVPWARSHVIPDLECGSKYYWEVRKDYILDAKECRFSLLMWCCSRADRISYRKDKDPSQENVQRQQEKRCRIECFDCYGEAKVVVDLTCRTMEVFIQHLSKHENPHCRENNVPPTAIAFLETHVNSQLRRADLYNMLCKEGLIDPIHVRKAQVNFWIFELLGRAYVRDVKNQLLLAKLVLEDPSMRSKDFHVTLSEDSETLAAMGFVTPFWSKVDCVHEIVVDSIFKTNALKFELFAVSANIGGVRMPLSYLLFNKRKDDSGVQGNETVRRQTLTSWFAAMQQRCSKPTS